MGPFSTAMVFDSIRNLSQCLIDGVFHDNIFFEPIDAALVQEGFRLFCEKYSLEPMQFQSVRSILALGIWWNRQFEILEDEEEVLEEETIVAVEEPSEETAEEEVVLTAEDIADKFERHFMRAGRAYLRSKELTKLLNANIEFKLEEDESAPQYKLNTRKGYVMHDVSDERVKKTQLWKDLNIDTYDRMSVLKMELDKIQNHSGSVTIVPV